MSDRVLLLVRHAKAVQDAPTDAQRALADRGRRDAEAAGGWLAQLGIVPDLAVVSPAVRAQQTWDAIATTFASGDRWADRRIYGNTVADLFAVIADVPDDVRTLALVGHNPSMHGLAVTLDNGSGDAVSRAAIRDGYPTCGIAIFDVAASWSGLASAEATLRTFAAPRA